MAFPVAVAVRELDRIDVAGGNIRGQNKVYAAMPALFLTDVALKSNVAATSLLLGLSGTA